MIALSALGAANAAIRRRFASLACLIGDTPLIAVDVRFRGVPRTVYAKAEYLNYTGSIKDRMALHILSVAHAAGQLAPGAPIAEATSGNTGIAFAAIGRALGHPVTIFMPDWMSQERKDLIRSLGATVRLVSRDEGGFLGAIALAAAFAQRHPGTFLPRQFDNEDNSAAHYASTGPEIARQLRDIGLAPAAFVAGVGTGGTIMGAGRYLRERHPGIRLHPLEPANSPTLSTGCKVGRHRIQGISDEFIPAICQLQALDAVIAVDDGDAIRMAQRLSAELGLPVGISSGANLLGALIAGERIGPEAVVATIFCDDNKKYLSTDLMRHEPAQPDHTSDQVELLEFRVVARCGVRAPGSCP
jgi:cysteine synthase A